MREQRDYDDIPGTYVFDGYHLMKGYHLNMFCKSLDSKSNRDAFGADPKGYLSKFPMTGEQRDMVLNRDWLGLLRVGGNIYFTWKLAAFDRLTMQQAGAAMSREGMTGDDFRQLMLDGGRPIEGNRSKSEWE